MENREIVDTLMTSRWKSLEKDSSKFRSALRASIKNTYENETLTSKIKRLEKINNELKLELQQSIKLPCKVGDKIYEIFCGKVNEYEIEKMNDVLIEVKHIEALDHTLSAFHSRHLGKDVFLTKEEAEIALKGE